MRNKERDCFTERAPIPQLFTSLVPIFPEWGGHKSVRCWEVWAQNKSCSLFMRGQLEMSHTQTNSTGAANSLTVGCYDREASSKHWAMALTLEEFFNPSEILNSGVVGLIFLPFPFSLLWVTSHRQIFWQMLGQRMMCRDLPPTSCSHQEWMPHGQTLGVQPPDHSRGKGVVSSGGHHVCCIHAPGWIPFGWRR